MQDAKQPLPPSVRDELAALLGRIDVEVQSVPVRGGVGTPADYAIINIRNMLRIYQGRN